MTENVTNELLQELLRALHTRFDTIERKVDDLAANVRETNSHLALVMGGRVRTEHTIAELEARIARAERRLDLRDA